MVIIMVRQLLGGQRYGLLKQGVRKANTAQWKAAEGHEGHTDPPPDLPPDLPPGLPTGQHALGLFIDFLRFPYYQLLIALPHCETSHASSPFQRELLLLARCVLA